MARPYGLMHAALAARTGARFHFDLFAQRHAIAASSDWHHPLDPSAESVVARMKAETKAAEPMP